MKITERITLLNTDQHLVLVLDPETREMVLDCPRTIHTNSTIKFDDLKDAVDKFTALVSRQLVCPHCQEMAPYGDERIIWLRAHLESRLHRWRWKFKNRHK